VRAEAERICATTACFEQDEFGNLLARLQTSPEKRPLVLAAHRPSGFRDPSACSLRIAGSRDSWAVSPDTTFTLIAVRSHAGSHARETWKTAGRGKQFEIHAPTAPAVAPVFAVWEMDDFSVDGPRIVGRACDDLVGVAAILATLIELKQTGEGVNLIGVISRAEEIGFNGALTVAASTRLPKNSLVISLETSREMPPVQMGEGVIIRVGDRTSIFDSVATRFLEEVAANLSAPDKQFQFQRALMSGGTCEATAYQEFGFQTAAVCVALGNYHSFAANAAGFRWSSSSSKPRRATMRHGPIAGRMAPRISRLPGESRRSFRARMQENAGNRAKLSTPAVSPQEHQGCLKVKRGEIMEHTLAAPREAHRKPLSTSSPLHAGIIRSMILGKPVLTENRGSPG
jgi:hypothetical protein